MIVLCGKTCSGKDEIVKELVSTYGFNKIVTTTTRPMRKGEKQDEVYHFVSEDEFFKRIEDNRFVEYKTYETEFGKWYYGTAKEDLDKATDKSVIIVTPYGYLDICKYLGYEPFCVYVYANDSTLKKRFAKRGDDKKEFERRLQKDKTDFRGFEEKASKIVYNNDGANIKEVVGTILMYAEDYN